MNIEDLPEDSDTSDEDYIPSGKPEEVVSEVDSDGDPEDPLSETEDLGKRNQKRKKKNTKRMKKLKANAGNLESAEETPEVVKVVTEEEENKKSDLLWADFMKDTGFKAKTAKTENGTSTSKPENSEVKQKETTVRIKQVFNFAGEDVVIEKEVPAESAQARLLQKPQSSSAEVPKSNRGRGKASLGGIGSVLKQIGRKPKISTLEKTKLDWDTYKKEENIADELSLHNKGKDGYLEKQDFLQRTDVRRFEIERNIRTIERNKRLDNVM